MDETEAGGTAYETKAVKLTAVPAKTDGTEGYEIIATPSTSENASSNGFEYSYALSANFDDTTADKVTYNINGACDSVANWETVDLTALSISLVWSCVEYVDTKFEAASSTALTYDKFDATANEGEGGDATASLTIAKYNGYGEDTISVKVGETALSTSNVTVAEGKVDVSASYLLTLEDGDTVFTITQGSGDSAQNVTQTVTISDTTPAPPVVNTAPSIAVTTLNYSKTRGATVAVNLARM